MTNEAKPVHIGDVMRHILSGWRAAGIITPEQEAGAVAETNEQDPTVIDITIPLPPITAYSLAIQKA